MLHSDITDLILKAYYRVYNTLGFGFLEKVYERALMIELVRLGCNPVRQQPIEVQYEGEVVGTYFADIVVNESVIIEIKAASALCEEHEHQLINYLKATNMEVGLLLNFGQQPEFKRKIFTNDNPRKSVASA